jgi:hypothetical protein
MRAIWKVGAVLGPVFMGWAAQAVAQPLDGRTARDALFITQDSTTALVSGVLPEDQASLLAQVTAGQAFYGAVAISPDAGLMAEATVAAVNHHSVEAAAAAAVRDCNAKKTGKADCVVAAIIRPKGWAEGRALQLSATATAAFRADYGRRGARALAMSPATGAFGMAQGDGAAAAALADCARDGASDCVVAVAD